MAYLSEKGYTSDLFVSYAHVDDESFAGSKRRWVTSFISDLKRTIITKLKKGKDLNLWMDHQLGGTLDNIMKALNGTGALLVIMSRGYLDSDWCSKERIEFLKLIQGRIEDGCRVIIVEIDKVDEKEFPPEFNNIVRKKFWEKDDEDVTARPLGFPVPNVDKPEHDVYYKELNDLSAQIAGELERIKSGLPASAKVYDAKKTIFLAEVTDDLDRIRGEVKGYLEQAGYHVIPEDTLTDSNNLEVFNKIHNEGLSKSSVFVQLLSNLPGKKSFNQTKGLVRLRYEAAAGNGIKILQWRSPKLDLEKDVDADQLNLIKGPNVRAEGIEDFKRAIIDSFIIQTPESSVSSEKLIYVVTDGQDRQLAKENICSALLSKGFDFQMSIEDPDPAKVRKSHEELLKNCDAALITYCHADPTSVSSQLMFCIKTLKQQPKPHKLVALYDGPPDKKSSVEAGAANYRYLNCRNNSDDFDNFLNSLQSASK